MNRENASFLLGGIFFGFLVGFSVAYTVHRGTAGAGHAGGGMQAPANPSDPMGEGAAGGMPGGPGGSPDGTAMMEQVQQEIAALRKALEQNPRDASVLGRLGDIYYDAGMYDRASEFYARSLESDPKNPNISTDLGICYQRLGRAEEAVAQFRRSLGIDPNHWQSWLNLGIVSLFDRNDVKTAEEAFAKVRQLNPSFEGLPRIEQALKQAKSGGKP